MRRHFINLPDADLAYLPEGTKHFDDYVEGVSWAQEYAMTNRRLIRRVAGLLNVPHPDFIDAKTRARRESGG